MTDFLMPQPLQVVVDDVGWWNGEDGSARGEPFRTGMPRRHAVADYQALADLGRRTGTRPVAAFVLGEWDRWNLLRALPSATWMGEAWDNRRWDGPWLDEAADLIRRESAHLELALHGLCHEFWHWDAGPGQGAFTRAEWFTQDLNMRPRDDIQKHLDAYFDLWDRHRLGARPAWFVPCAFYYRTGLAEAGMAPLLRKAGITAVSTPFNRLGHSAPLPAEPFFFDAGLLMLDRSQNDIPWRQIGPSPDYPVRGPTLGLHWPQLLHADPARNGEAVDVWVNLLNRAAAQPDRMLAPDSARYIDQLLHRAFTTLTAAPGAITLDARAFFAQPNRPRRTMVYLKSSSRHRVFFLETNVNGSGDLFSVPLEASEPVRTLSFR
jgi:hypothetical protein